MFALIIMAIIYFGSRYYNRILTPLILPGEESEYHLYISTGTDMDSFIELLGREKIVSDTSGFRWLAKKKNLGNNLYPGHYILYRDMTNTDLVNMVRSGQQKPVKVVFNNIRSLEKLAGLVSQQLEIDSLSLLEYFKESCSGEDREWNLQTFPALFIPNTYEFYWNVSAKSFVERMQKEYDAFWTQSRLEKAGKLGLVPVEVSTLASIVDEETYRDDELPLIAGVYLNRLKKRYRLQADPTIKFATGKLEANRILKEDLEVDSPYNTYRNYGLPPGPISIPSIASIDAVLNPEMKGYLYFCAKEDFSGYHNFARNLIEHNRNAQKYQQALNRRRIYK